MASLKAAVIGAGNHGSRPPSDDRRRAPRCGWSAWRTSTSSAWRRRPHSNPRSPSPTTARCWTTPGPDVVYVVTLPGHLLPIVRECLGTRHPHVGREVARQHQRRHGGHDRGRGRQHGHGHRLLQPALLSARSSPSSGWRSNAAARSTPPPPTTRTRATAWSRTCAGVSCRRR